MDRSHLLESASASMLAALLSAAASGQRIFSERLLVQAALEDLTPEEKDVLKDNSVYAYESREGPWDYLVDRAEKLGLVRFDEGHGWLPGTQA